METFLGKSQSCSMTASSGAFDNSCFDGNTILLRVGIENGKINMYILVVIWYVLLWLVMIYINMFLIWEII